MRCSVSTVLESCYIFLFDKCNFSHCGCVAVITSVQFLLIFLQCVLCYKDIAYYSGSLCLQYQYYILSGSH